MDKGMQSNNYKIVPKCNFFSHLLNSIKESNFTTREITVVDIGCGNKPYKKLIESRFPNKKITYVGLDYYTTDADINLDINSESIPMDDNSVDLIICTEVLEHLHNPFFALSEIKRIIKNNGISLITIPLLSPVHEKEHDYFRFTHNFFRKYFKGDTIDEEIFSNTFFSYFIYVIEYYVGRIFDVFNINIGGTSTKIVGILQYPLDIIGISLAGGKFLTYSSYVGIGYLIKSKK